MCPSITVRGGLKYTSYMSPLFSPSLRLPSRKMRTSPCHNDNLFVCASLTSLERRNHLHSSISWPIAFPWVCEGDCMWNTLTSTYGSCGMNCLVSVFTLAANFIFTKELLNALRAVDSYTYYCNNGSWPTHARLDTLIYLLSVGTTSTCISGYITLQRPT